MCDSRLVSMSTEDDLEESDFWVGGGGGWMVGGWEGGGFVGG